MRFKPNLDGILIPSRNLASELILSAGLHVMLVARRAKYSEVHAYSSEGNAYDT
jgi:hypothetical protein